MGLLQVKRISDFNFPHGWSNVMKDADSVHYKIKNKTAVHSSSFEESNNALYLGLNVIQQSALQKSFCK